MGKSCHNCGHLCGVIGEYGIPFIGECGIPVCDLNADEQSCGSDLKWWIPNREILVEAVFKLSRDYHNAIGHIPVSDDEVAETVRDYVERAVGLR